MWIVQPSFKMVPNNLMENIEKYNGDDYETKKMQCNQKMQIYVPKSSAMTN